MVILISNRNFYLRWELKFWGKSDLDWTFSSQMGILITGRNFYVRWEFLSKMGNPISGGILISDRKRYIRGGSSYVSSQVECVVPGFRFRFCCQHFKYGVNLNL